MKEIFREFIKEATSPVQLTGLGIGILLVIFVVVPIFNGCDTADASYKAKYDAQVLLTEAQVLLTDSLQIKNAQINANLDKLKTTAFHVIDSLKIKIATMPDSTYWVDIYYKTRTEPLLNAINERVVSIVDSLKKR